ncbi:MAG: hypothetical protein ACREP1_09760, partial [Rhodanobacteraceae bacterium]
MKTSAALMVLIVSGLTASAQPTPYPSPASAMNSIAERYIKLVLAMTPHDPDYVDAYYGPPAWKSEVVAAKKPLAAIGEQAARLRAELVKVPLPNDQMEKLRHEFLSKQLGALGARVRLLQGAKMTFDQQSQALYDSVAPHYSDAHFQRLIDDIEATGVLKPKDASDHRTLAQRYADWRKAFIIPNDKLATVFQLAIKECRTRTLAHLSLPPEESFTVEYVTGKPWGGYNWYKGNYHSVIQVNTDLPTYIDRAVDLAAHEGYPGHHVYNSLLEKNLTRGRGWLEFSVYPLYSPQSLIAEGTANFGREVVFTKPERLQFEKKVLWPAAGLDPARVEEYYKVQDLVEKLGYATNEAARQLIDGKIDAAAAAVWLEKYAMQEPAIAQKRVQF